VAAENDDTTVRFEIAGNTYDYPDPLDLDLDEWVIIYDECGLILEDFAPCDNIALEKERVRRLRNPALMKALAIVGYKRANPDQDIETARALIGGAKMLGLLESMAPGEDDADDPTPDSPTGPDESSERKPDDSNGSSSPASPLSSETPDDELATTGTGG